MTTNNEKVLLYLLAIVIGVFGLWNIQSLYGPIVMPDETGFWAAGEYFAGKDWSGIMSVSPYYGLGYGLILAPLIFIFQEPVIVFRAAIVLNAVSLILCYFISISVMKILFPRIKLPYIYLSCFVVATYSSYLYNTQTTYVESMILLFFWVIVYCLVKVSLKMKCRYIIGITLSSVYLFALHQRTIGVMISVILVIILLFINKKLNWKHILMFFLVLSCALVLVALVKNNLIANIYHNSSHVGGNDFSGQTSKLSYIFSIKGFFVLIMNVIGRLMYLGGATFLVFFWGIYILVLDFVKIFKTRLNKESREEVFIEVKIFFVLAVLSAIGISALFMVEFSRLDHIIYGRYSEHVIAPIMLIAILNISNLKNNQVKKLQIICVTVQIVITIGIYLYVFVLQPLEPGPYAIAGIYGISSLDTSPNSVRLTLQMSIVIILVSSFLIFLASDCKRKILFYILLSSIWVYLAFNVASSTLYTAANTERKRSNLGKEIESMVESKPIYYIVDESEYFTSIYWAIFRLQFYIPDVSLRIVTTSEFNELEKSDYVILHQDSHSFGLVSKQYKLLKTELGYYVFEKY